MLHLRRAQADDCRLLAELNEQLILDEGHDNPMRGKELEDRMRDWLSDGFEAAVGTVDGVPACYALWRPDGANRIHLRQFFVARDQRRLGLGRCHRCAPRRPLALRSSDQP